jgi:hypothetical protein
VQGVFDKVAGRMVSKDKAHKRQANYDVAGVCEVCIICCCFLTGNVIGHQLDSFYDTQAYQESSYAGISC